MSEKSGILKKVKDGFIESYTKQKEHDKENFKLEKQLSKARHEEAIKPNPDFVEFKESKGLIEKTKTIGRQI